MPHLKDFIGENVTDQLIAWVIENPTYDYKIIYAREKYIQIIYKGSW